VFLEASLPQPMGIAGWLCHNAHLLRSLVRESLLAAVPVGGELLQLLLASPTRRMGDDIAGLMGQPDE
jgi:hypothetical protein